MTCNINSLARTAIALMLLTLPGFGDTTTKFIYKGTPRSTNLNENVEADFLLSGGELFVTLWNNVSGLEYDGQVLTGVAFSFAGAGTATGTVINPIVQSYAINDKDGNLTPWGKPASANWHTEVDLSGFITLTNLNNGNRAGSQGIISTSTAGAGTNNLANHNNFIEGPVTFEISGLGVTSTAAITTVEFNFGTAIGAFTPAVAPQVTAQRQPEMPPSPEPATIVLVLGGFGLLFIGSIKRKAVVQQ
jgi:hypothetical protein